MAEIQYCNICFYKNLCYEDMHDIAKISVQYCQAMESMT